MMILKEERELKKIIGYKTEEQRRFMRKSNLSESLSISVKMLLRLKIAVFTDIFSTLKKTTRKDFSRLIK